MPGWQNSDRRSRLPRDWPVRRRRILTRDGGTCTQVREDTGRRCNAPATDVDHVHPGDDHSDSNLTSLCGWHHRQKSSSEGGQANAARHLAPARKHPGVL
jgi:5-methylcytosine-specific restriction endonuclease McrA